MVKWIADVGSNHNGKLDRAKALIKTAKRIGCWGVKFQLFNAKKLWTEKKTIRKMVGWEFNCSWMYALYKLAVEYEIQLGYTPFDIDAVFLLRNRANFVKIGSYEMLFQRLTYCIANDTNIPIIVSTGMATVEEIDNMVGSILLRRKKEDLILLHCSSEYPANPNRCHMATIPTYRNKWGLPVGWSDHTGKPGVLFAALAMGASHIEFHLDLDGRGYEYPIGHCWLPCNIETVIEQSKYFNNAMDVYPYSHQLIDEYKTITRLRKSRTNAEGRRIT